MTNNPSLGTVAVATAGAALVGAAFYKARLSKKVDPEAKRAEEIRSSRAKWDSETWDEHLGKHGELREIWPDTLYMLEAEGCGQGPPERNMCIYRPPGGSGRLVIWNGIAVNDETISEIEKLGKPAVLVVPNCYHRCCSAVWKKKYPNMMVVCPEAAVDCASEAVGIDKTIDEWVDMPEYKRYIQATTIDGWGPLENVLELQLGKSSRGKKAFVVCDMLFTVPLPEKPGYMESFMFWLFDSFVVPPPEGEMVVPKVARISRIFAIQNWPKAEQWYRTYAKEHGKDVAVIVVGHGPPVVEMNKDEGCTKAFEGVADQLMKPRW
eukprot:CAMPEP_0178693304 /NCGR_PEP_ID=MMETSP0699-20121125/7639_1 /TAXON_ID=265572 /ORGANISM="Extubocellulus spinifer, Strain CCMP396" /LENGTH=321 /DNA_ID=CAMNT_0020338703 /DNA_START=44 /DNA_END=1009 /DNA_ORIENTATION=+